MKKEVITLKDLFDNFIFLSQVNGKKPKTITWYKEILTPFVNSTSLEELNILTIRKYIATLKKRGLKEATIHCHIRALRTFLKFLYEEGYLEENLSQKIKSPKLPKQYPYVLSDEDIHKLIKACNKNLWEGFRNYVIIILILDTGIRLSELINLTLQDINWAKKSIFIRNGKGGKDREVYMGRTLARELNKWIKMRGFFPYEERVFITRQGYPLNKRMVDKIFQRLSEKAGIKNVRCSPHTLRHTFATNFIRNGGDVFSLQKILGHSDISTCMIYVHMGGKQIQEAMLKFSPVDRLERY
ncbi:MAG: tyrosine-type recombinase/integrase [Elusimicrobiota bacterium]|nr:tyrosine-type recombinase/integrase [Endomicrobiia bacterium]MDW8165995.1 tyrosine-type recombinase/integrase [Elusimicrobiota bacterium]